jgi:hypothetical protein
MPTPRDPEAAAYAAEAAAETIIAIASGDAAKAIASAIARACWLRQAA